MNYKLKLAGYSAALVAGLAGLAALTYNNWLLGPILNQPLFVGDGSISEYSAGSQPHYLVFRGLDIISGLLLILLAGLFFQSLQKTKPGKLLVIATAVLGLANIMDALLALPCSETLNRDCSLPVNLSVTHFQVPGHAYSSTLIAVCYLLLPTAGLIYGYKPKLRVLMLASLVLIIDVAVSFISALWQYHSQHSLSVRTSGAGQEFQLSIIGIWFIVAYTSIWRHTKTSSVTS